MTETGDLPKGRDEKWGQKGRWRYQEGREKQGQREGKIAIKTETLGDQEGVTVKARSTEDARMHRVKSRGQMVHIGHSSASEAKAEG